MILYFIILLLCSTAGILLFKDIPSIKTSKQKPKKIKVSIVIPARNEESNLAFLLTDLKKQSFDIHEILCVDDNSTDNTIQIIKNFNVDYLQITEKDKDWTGKTWACQVGAEKATGEVILFIDADVRMGSDTIENLVAEYLLDKKVVSVQPYHEVIDFYEQFAFFFNVIGIGGNGAALPYSKKKAGLFGPVILISKQDFEQIGGFYYVRKSVIEDVELGKLLTKNNLEFKLFVGDRSLYFKMYASFKELLLGFIKNYASGASKTPFILFVLTFIWVQSMTVYPLLIINSIINNSNIELYFSVFMYIITCIHLIFIGKKIGSFKKRYIIVYPMLLIVFHVVFIYSSFLKILGKKVNWKGRQISLNK